MSKKFTTQIFAFLHQVNRAPELFAADIQVSMELSRYFTEDDEGGRAFPSCKTIGDKIGLSEHTVIRSVRRLEANGHLRVIWGSQGRGHPNQYWMVLKPASVQVSEAKKPAPVQVSTPTVKPASVKIKPAPVQENLLKNHDRGAQAPPCRGERNELSLDDDVPGERGPDGPLAGSEGKNTALVVVSHRFEELFNGWDRGHPADASAARRQGARRAFAAACSTADPDEIIAGARAWFASYEAGDGVRYLPRLDEWLDARSWEKPPRRKRPRKRSLADAMADKLCDGDAA